MYRRRVDELFTLRAVFANPRVHTHDGYSERVNMREGGGPCRLVESTRSAACPACGKMFARASNAVGHYESGGCPTCRDESQARRNVHAYASSQGAGFLVKRIGYFGEEVDGYQSDDGNFRCNACGKEFVRLGSLMQHQEMRAMCRQESASTYAPQITHNTSWSSSSDDKYRVASSDDVQPKIETKRNERMRSVDLERRGIHQETKQIVTRYAIFYVGSLRG